LATPSNAAVLDSVGRYFLSTLDYRLYGLLALVFTGAFALWRKVRYESWPTHQDCIAFVIGLAAMIGGVAVMMVFLLTKPPAVDMLSGEALALLGLLVPFVIFGNAYPRLRALLFPREAPKPPKDTLPE